MLTYQLILFALYYVVILLNTYRLNQSMPLVGFLNPTLYSNKSTALFNDITSGSNNCCSYNGARYTESHASCCAQGFSAAAGWDPVTGLGSVYFPRFAAMFDVPLPLELLSYTYEHTSPFALSSNYIALLVVLGFLFLIAVSLAMCYVHRPKSSQYIFGASEVTAKAPSCRSSIAPTDSTNSTQATPRKPTHAAASSQSIDVETATTVQAQFFRQSAGRASAGSGRESWGLSPSGRLSVPSDALIVTASGSLDSPTVHWADWSTELSILADMGFTDRSRIVPLLDQYMDAPVSSDPSRHGLPDQQRLDMVIQKLLALGFASLTDSYRAAILDRQRIVADA